MSSLKRLLKTPGLDPATRLVLIALSNGTLDTLEMRPEQKNRCIKKLKILNIYKNGRLLDKEDLEWKVKSVSYLDLDPKEWTLCNWYFFYRDMYYEMTDRKYEKVVGDHIALNKLISEFEAPELRELIRTYLHTWRTYKWARPWPSISALYKNNIRVAMKRRINEVRIRL